MTTNNYYTTEIFDKGHFHFGGTIYLSDFNTDYRGDDNIHGSTIASRIESDFRWERKTLTKNTKQREVKKNAKI